MSRIANNPVAIPAGVEINITKDLLTVKGKLGQLSQAILTGVAVAQTDGKLTFKPSTKLRDAAAGTMRAITSNMVKGVSVGFEKKLSMRGVGYRAKTEGSKLALTAGFSHPVELDMPEGIKIETPSQTDIIVKGVDKQKVAQMAANIRSIRPPEPYKGKGIRYADEVIILKEGKKK